MTTEDKNTSAIETQTIGQDPNDDWAAMKEKIQKNADRIIKPAAGKENDPLEQQKIEYKKAAYILKEGSLWYVDTYGTQPSGDVATTTEQAIKDLDSEKEPMRL